MIGAEDLISWFFSMIANIYLIENNNNYFARQILSAYIRGRKASAEQTVVEEGVNRPEALDGYRVSVLANGAMTKRRSFLLQYE